MMPHAPTSLRKTNRRGTTTNGNPPVKAQYISDALCSWIKNVIAPALVKAYLAEQNLRIGEVHG
jgi:hypothetical protein